MLAAGRVMTRSAPGLRGGPGKAGSAAFSGEQKTAHLHHRSQKSGTNGKLQIHAGCIGCVEQHSLIASFGGSMLT